MWNLVFILMLSAAGSLAIDMLGGQCAIDKCDTSPLLGGIAGTIPNGEELEVLCPPLLERIICKKKAVKECTGNSIDDLASSDNNTVASFANLMLNIEGVIIDVCDEDTILHAGYVSSAACFNDVIKEHSPKCHKEAVAVYDSYRDSTKLLDEETSENKMQDADCLVSAYVTACFSLDIRDRCGEVARATFVEFLRRVNFLSFSSGACTPEQLAVLKTEYLEYLEFEEEKKSWYSEVFHTRK